ncbi:Methyltransferase type 11 domain protein [Rhodopirellula maiorica SM1]|uniref:Methyltransferase type 11 domain protein n=1 Tax=Rhodopirellula maiorica SM1 TaxID=1265738 RepID=M5RQI1_9BACT|nr:class I SAM-dependent methyltransferase [Rhodopirellula maiorica]EMI17642.1 Methyltransferase type 11 domain protein [Rhodopirellula maiorica SM1]
MSITLPTQADQWEEHLVATAQETIAHCQGLYDADHLKPLFDVLPPESKIVEAGCGLGQFVYMFASLGHHCIGLDYSAKLIEDAQARGENLKDLPGTTDWVEGTILDLPFEDNSLDCYASFGVLEHFTRDQQRIILSEAHRVLKPGGLLYQFVPNFWSPWTMRREIRYWYRKAVPPSIVWQKNIRRSLLKKMCAEPGFEEVSCQSVYAGVALRSMRPPNRVRRLAPARIRQSSQHIVDRMARWLDRRDVLGYGLVYVGKK